MIMTSCSYIYMYLVSKVRCGSSTDEWEMFTIDSLDLTMDFANAKKLATNCKSYELEFEFEVDYRTSTTQPTNLPNNQTNNQSSTQPTNESLKQPINRPRKVLTITACTAAAVLATVLVFTYGKEVLISYLQSGTYNVQQYNRARTDFQELR